MIKFVRLQSARDPLFAQALALYKTSFPPHEQRPDDKQAALMANSRYHFAAILEDGTFCGLLLYWEFAGYAYIEHFAIDAARRGHSLGSRSLAAFCEHRPLVILEIDPPVDEIAIRREGFYRRLGFCTNSYPHAHPAYRAGRPPHELVVMSRPGPLSEFAYARFYRDLADTVMRDVEL